MIRVFVVYEGEVDPARYEEHVAFAQRVPDAVFRHGQVFGAPTGEPDFYHYAEFEYADRGSFERSLASSEMNETGKDALAMGVPFRVHFAEVE